MEGWIKLHRSVNNHVIMEDPHLLQLWIYLITNANHKAGRCVIGGKVVYLEAGQGIFGTRKIVQHLTGLSYSNSKRFKKMHSLYYRKLKLLEEMGSIVRLPAGKFTIISITNWSQYQGVDKASKVPTVEPKSEDVPKPVEPSAADIRILEDRRNQKNNRNKKFMDYKSSKAKAVANGESFSLTFDQWLSENGYKELVNL